MVDLRPSLASGGTSCTSWVFPTTGRSVEGQAAVGCFTYPGDMHRRGTRRLRIQHNLATMPLAWRGSAEENNRIILQLATAWSWVWETLDRENLNLGFGPKQSWNHEITPLFCHQGKGRDRAHYTLVLYGRKTEPKKLKTARHWRSGRLVVRVGLSAGSTEAWPRVAKHKTDKDTPLSIYPLHSWHT